MVEPDDTDTYILDANHQAVPVADFEQWIAWMRTTDHHVADDDVGPYRISTVFLGTDHNFRRFEPDAGPPILFETATFTRAGLLMVNERYETWLAAFQGHAEILGKMRQAANG